MRNTLGHLILSLSLTVCSAVYLPVLSLAQSKFSACESQLDITLHSGPTTTRPVRLPGKEDFALVFDWHTLAPDLQGSAAAIQIAKENIEVAMVEALEALGQKIPGVWAALPNRVLVQMKSTPGSACSSRIPRIEQQLFEDIRHTIGIFLHEFGHMVLFMNIPSSTFGHPLAAGMSEFFADVFSAMWSQDPELIHQAIQVRTPGEKSNPRLGAFYFEIDKLRLFRGFHPLSSFIDTLKTLKRNEDVLIQDNVILSLKLIRGHSFLGWARQQLGQHWMDLEPSQLLVPRLLQLIEELVPLYDGWMLKIDDGLFLEIEKLNQTIVERMGWSN